MYNAYMKWPNAGVPQPIVTHVTQEFAEAAARERLARWFGNCRELPECYVVYNNTGERVYTAPTGKAVA